MSVAETNDERTIIDYLNEDCWRAVLQYVPLQDIVRSERVSQEWQSVVLIYLRSVRVDIKQVPVPKRPTYIAPLVQLKCCTFDDESNVKKSKVCHIKFTEDRLCLFHRWTYKLGPSIETFFCDCEGSLEILENCLNLEKLTLINISEKVILRNECVNFKWLKILFLQGCVFLSDRCVSRFISNNALKELEIHKAVKITGESLINKNMTHLKSLLIRYCHEIEFRHLLAAAEYLSQLVKLELSGLPGEIYNNIHLLLEKMPKLEHIHIRHATNGASFFKSVSRLYKLTYLSVSLEVTDEDLETLSRSCSKLRYLDVPNSRAVTGRGLAAVSRYAGARLTLFGLRNSHFVTDDDIEAFVRACPNLTTLSLHWCYRLTAALVPRAAAARRELRARIPLRICSISSEFSDYRRENGNQCPFSEINLCTR